MAILARVKFPEPWRPEPLGKPAAKCEKPDEKVEFH